MADIRRAMHASAAGVDSLATLPAGEVRAQEDDRAPDPTDPFVGEAKWPAWKVTLAVVVFCGAFWAGVSYLVARLFG